MQSTWELPHVHLENVRPRGGGTAGRGTDVVDDDVAVGQIKAEFCFVSLKK